VSSSVPEDLLAFGLTEHQALAYRALVKLGSATAREVADTGGIPRNRAYEVLEALQTLDLVDVTLDEKRRFTAKPLAPYVDRFLGNLQARTSALKEARESLLQKYDVAEGDGLSASGQIRMVRGRQPNVQAICGMVGRATRRVEAILDPATLRLLVASPGFLESLTRLHHSGGRVLLLVPVIEETQAAVEEARAALGDAVRALASPNPPMVSRVVCDGALHFCQRSAATATSSQILGLTTDHGVLVADAEALLADLRLQSVDAAERLTDLYEGRPPGVEVVLRDPQAREDRLLEAVAGARATLELFGAPAGLTAALRGRLREGLEGAAGRGVKVRALARVGPDTLADVDALLSGTEVRHAPVGGAGTWTLLVDRCRALEFLGSTAVDSTVAGRVTLLANSFDEAWVSAAPLEDRRRELTRGSEGPGLLRAVAGSAATWETLRAALAGARRRVLLTQGEALRGPRGEAVVDLLDAVQDPAVEVRVVSFSEAPASARVPKRLKPEVRRLKVPAPPQGSLLVDGEEAYWWAVAEDAAAPQPMDALVLSRDAGTLARAERAFERLWSTTGAPVPVVKGSAPTLRVLVVDDAEQVRDVIARYLKEVPGRDVTVETCASAKDALARIEAERFDAVISDYRIPDGDGVVVLERVRAVAPGTVRVLLTGYREMRIAREAINRANISLLLEKPFRREDLLSRLLPLLEAQSEEASRNRAVARALYAAAAHLSLLEDAS